MTQGKIFSLFIILVIFGLFSLSYGKKEAKDSCRKPRQQIKKSCRTPARPQKSKPSPSPPPPPPFGISLYTYEILDELPHDEEAFTQGLQLYQSCKNCTHTALESLGLYGKSEIREVEIDTGKVLRSKSIPDSEFGEGLVSIGDRVYQLLWQTNKLYSYEIDDFSNVNPGQTEMTDGWGLTTNGTHLIASDSSNVLTFMKPSDYTTVKQIEVMFQGDPVIHLNELEWVDGYILANIYGKECIAKIDPANGNVVGWILLNGLAEKTLGKENMDGIKVMNGIAVITEEEEDTIYVTGKLWPTLYKILLKPLANWDAYGSPSEIKGICMIDPQDARF